MKFLQIITTLILAVILLKPTPQPEIKTEFLPFFIPTPTLTSAPNIEEKLSDELLILEVTATAYAPFEDKGLCSDGNPNSTATGTNPTPNRTLAVDPSLIPYGSEVYIPGKGLYIAEDTGGAINGPRIDIMFEKRQEALDFGVQDKTIVVKTP